MTKEALEQKQEAAEQDRQKVKNPFSAQNTYTYICKILISKSRPRPALPPGTSFPQCDRAFWAKMDS